MTPTQPSQDALGQIAGLPLATEGTCDLVQTLLQYPWFEASVRALDPCRLGKQRVECIQVLRG